MMLPETYEIRSGLETLLWPDCDGVWKAAMQAKTEMDARRSWENLVLPVSCWQYSANLAFLVVKAETRWMRVIAFKQLMRGNPVDWWLWHIRNNCRDIDISRECGRLLAMPECHGWMLFATYDIGGANEGMVQRWQAPACEDFAGISTQNPGHRWTPLTPDRIDMAAMNHRRFIGERLMVEGERLKGMGTLVPFPIEKI